jgi:hypothetical protein
MAVARRLSLRKNVGETLLGAKLQILTGAGNRRPSIALSILTGRIAEQLSILENFYPGDPVVAPVPVADQPMLEVTEASTRPHYVARTVYLADEHLRDIDFIIETLSTQYLESRRVTRSSVLRQAVEHLRAAVEADPAMSLWENE